jgi:very-short-patch-repair endonuclease
MKEEVPRLEIPADLRRKMVEIARQFRKEPTPSEAILWQALRGKKLDGIKFRRQQPIGSFVVDFYNSTYRLIVEVDGPIHDYQIEVDRSRQEVLEILGLNILRLKVDMIETDLTAALSLIRAKIREIEQSSLLRMAEGWGEG